jgi:hypothetical protein
MTPLLGTPPPLLVDPRLHGGAVADLQLRKIAPELVTVPDNAQRLGHEPA